MSASPESFTAHARQRPAWRTFVTMTPTADVVAYEVRASRWNGPALNIACLADSHAMRPWSPLTALARHVEAVNRMAPDIVMLLGDYQSPHSTPGPSEDIAAQARILARLEAPLGVHAILGNHDWRDDPAAQESGMQTTSVSQALTEAGIRPLINTARRVTQAGQDFWVVGLDSQCAHRPDGGRGRQDADQAFAEVPDDSLAILLAHEPDYFIHGDRRPVLQLSGHTHGGQANLFGWRPFTPSAHSARYAYGHIVEEGQHLVVSAGLGYTHVPLRIMQPPEITLVRLTGEDD
ncbi:MAG: metallophosphoesterase [Pseudomonadota bacterium]